MDNADQSRHGVDISVGNYSPTDVIGIDLI